MKLRYFLVPLIFSIGFILFFNCSNSENNRSLVIDYNKVTQDSIVTKDTIIQFNLDLDNNPRKYGFNEESYNFITFDIPVEPYFWIDGSFSYEKFNTFSNFVQNIIYTKFFTIDIYNNNDIVLARNIYHTYSFDSNKIPFISLYNQNEDGDGINTPLSVQQFSEFKSLLLSLIINPKSKNIIEYKFNYIDSELFSHADNYYFDLKSGKFFEKESSTRLINFFEVINSKQSVFPNDVIAKLENKYNSQLNFNTELALQAFKSHYQYVNSINIKEAILDFKYNNFIKMPPNDNDVCFVKIPDNVAIEVHIVGQVKFVSNGYTLEPYNCTGGFNIQ